MDNVAQFAEKYQLARQSALRDTPGGGICGFELEWNLVDSHFGPLKSVQYGSKTYSFVDFLREQ